MTLAYLDIYVGISGDMLLGALVDAGAPLEPLRELCAALPGAVTVSAEPVTRGGLRGTRVHVHAHEPGGHDQADHHHPPHRTYAELAELTAALPVSATVRDRAQQVLRRIAEAEGAVHGVPVERVHFHELAGLDTVVDVAGACLLLEELGVEQVWASALPLSHGHVDTAHGRLPVPPPAVMELLRGAPTVPVDVEGETVTPTGAALAVTLAQGLGPPPPLTVRRVAYGAGSRQFPGTPNLLRLLLGEAATAAPAPGGDTVTLLETNLDDLSPELAPPLLEALLAAGALDAWLTPIQMKKGRPAFLVSALAAPAQADSVAEALLRHSSSFGVRLRTCERRCLARESRPVQTPWGPVAVKLGFLRAEAITASPEYEDCARLAREAGVPVRAVYAAAQAAAALLGASPPAGD